MESLENELDHRRASLESDLGDRVLDAVEERFPERTKARRRSDVAKAFVAGAALGLLSSYVLR